MFIQVYLIREASLNKSPTKIISKLSMKYILLGRVLNVRAPLYLKWRWYFHVFARDKHHR